jgi:hypothetical protein
MGECYRNPFRGFKEPLGKLFLRKELRNHEFAQKKRNRDFKL